MDFLYIVPLPRHLILPSKVAMKSRSSAQDRSSIATLAGIAPYFSRRIPSALCFGPMVDIVDQ
jgi:hypothetical protein